MPNDCTNIITIICKNTETLNQFIETELEVIRLSNNEHNEFIKILKKGKFGVIFRLWTPWNPDYDWLKNMLELHPEFWIKEVWQEFGSVILKKMTNRLLKVLCGKIYV